METGVPRRNLHVGRRRWDAGLGEPGGSARGRIRPGAAPIPTARRGGASATAGGRCEASFPLLFKFLGKRVKGSWLDQEHSNSHKERKCT